MPDRLEIALRKSVPLLVTASCLWGAGTFADELPESVRERALQELRALDRGPAAKAAPAAPRRSPSKAAAQLTPSPAKPSTDKVPETTRAFSTPASAGSADTSTPAATLPVHHEDVSSNSTRIEIAPTIQPARRTIVRPPIRSRPSSSNPWAEVAKPASALAKPSTATKGEFEPAGVRTNDDLPKTPQVSPFAEVLGDQLAPAAEATNPFDRDAEPNHWRPATSTSAGTTAAPNEESKDSSVAAPETQKRTPAVQEQRSVAVTKTFEDRSSKKVNGEQIGADRPVSVLDFLASNVGEAATSDRAINTARAPASSPNPVLADSIPKSVDVEHRSSAVVANGLPRSIRNDDPSQHPLESISESDARLATPPSEVVADRQTPATEQQKLEARIDRDGFMGFCPVTLRDNKTLVDGDPQFTSNFGGERFEFASAEAKATFDADPLRYCPANAGRDIVLAVGQIDVPGSLRHATYYKNRLYLFRSEQTRRLFEADPTRYVGEEGR